MYHFYDKNEETNALASRLRDEWIVLSDKFVTWFMDVDRRRLSRHFLESSTRKMDQQVKYIDHQHFSLELIYNCSKVCYYIEWPGFGIYKIEPGAVVQTYLVSGYRNGRFHEDSYGYITYGRYICESFGKQVEKSYLQQFSAWIENAFCLMPEHVAYYEAEYKIS